MPHSTQPLFNEINASQNTAIQNTAIQNTAIHVAAAQTTATPLGWSWIASPPAEYPISHKKLPFLSSEEMILIKNILEQFYAQAEWQRSPQDLQAALQRYCQLNHIFLDEEQQRYVLQCLRLHAWEYGPLSVLLEDPSLEEIAIAGIGNAFPIRVYVAGEGWKSTPICFTHAQTLITLLNRMALDSGKRLSSATPTLNARLQDGSRLHASIFPVCLHHVEATIRKFVFRPQTPEALIQSQIISPAALAFLMLGMRTDCNLLIVGNTGSGKTTTLNALLGMLSPQERFIVVEETPELQLVQPHVVRLTPSSGAKVELAELVRETLRMRPDRVVIGEMRFPEEAKAWMESILAGQGKGTYATFHGNSAAEALARLKQFGILEQDLGWSNIIVTQKRWSQYTDFAAKEMRAICEIAEVWSDENGKIKLNSIFEWDEKKKQLQHKNKSKIVKEKFGWSYSNTTFEHAWKELQLKLMSGLLERKDLGEEKE